ncbi:MAG: LOG family protein [Thermoproteota archaeon]
MQVAVAAYSGDLGQPYRREAQRFVERVAELCGRDTVMFLGGYRGLMRVVADEALKAGLQVVFVIPVDYEADSYPAGSVVVRTGLGPRERSAVLVRSGDVVVALGGGLGTLFEVFLAVSYGKRILMLRGFGAPSDKFADCYSDGVVDERFAARVEYYESGETLAEALCGG